MQIIVQNDDLESALKRFRKAVMKDGILGELKRREQGWRPGVRKKNKAMKAEIRRKRSLLRKKRTGTL